jgi:hypothetical protein
MQNSAGYSAANMKQYTTEQINQAANGTLDGSPTIMITGVDKYPRQQ